MTKQSVCAGLGPLNPCVAWLVLVFGAILLVGAFVLGSTLNLRYLQACVLLASGVTALLEVIRHYWSDQHGPATPAGSLRVLALLYGLSIVFYAMWHLTGGAVFIGGSSGGQDLSTGSAVLSAVLAVTTLVATKVAADARAEVLAAKTDMTHVVRALELDISLQKMLAWRVEIMLAMELIETDRQKFALLEGLGKTVKALKVPLEEAPRWGASTLNHSELIQRALQASALLKSTPDLAGAVQLILGRAGGENQLREVGETLGRFLEHVRSRHPQSTPAEHGAWEALAVLSQDLKRL